MLLTLSNHDHGHNTQTHLLLRVDSLPREDQDAPLRSLKRFGLLKSRRRKKKTHLKLSHPIHAWVQNVSFSQ